MAKAYLRLVKKARLTPEQQAGVLREELKRALEPVAAQHVAQRQAVVADWAHRPKFKGVVTVGPQRLFIRVILENGAAALSKYGGTIRDLWRWQNEGTGLYGPHKQFYAIRPRFAQALRFVVNGVVVFARYVFNPEKRTHPGLKGRQYGRRINERLRAYEDKQVRAGFHAAFKWLERENKR